MPPNSVGSTATPRTPAHTEILPEIYMDWGSQREVDGLISVSKVLKHDGKLLSLQPVLHFFVRSTGDSPTCAKETISASGAGWTWVASAMAIGLTEILARNMQVHRPFGHQDLGQLQILHRLRRWFPGSEIARGA